MDSAPEPSQTASVPLGTSPSTAVLASISERKSLVMDQSLLEWAQEAGFVMKSITVGYFEEGRGLKATEEIKVDEILIEVPREWIFDQATALESDIGHVIRENDALSDDPLSTLCLFVMYEGQNPKSKWKPYLDILPKEYDMPTEWTNEEIELLKGFKIYDDVFKKLEMLEKSYEQVQVLMKHYPEEFSADIHTYSKFRWAYNAIVSRGFRLEDKQPRLIPMVDMMNHPSIQKEGVQHCKITLDKDTKNFQVISTHHYLSGDQLWLNYGTKTNSEWLLDYGMISMNKDDYIVLELPEEMLADAIQIKEKQEFLEQNNLPTPRVGVDCCFRT
eukprot:TRINITY_DN21872_c0_g2_i2.p1 TRINITY_DN21872_c0_g2~~TRINITY_DN21872_c0_g2_i2.p1  ORF type:complete len:331 (+),score=88.52 TRINITY_DN21872_c0_g2_i2:183-1175(+)